jgi:hypothetical protein
VRIFQRLVAALAGIALAGVALYGLAFIELTALISLETPNPDPSLDAEPCCEYPDTWDEVHEGIAWMFGLAIVDALVVCAAGASLKWALTGRLPGWRRLILVPIGAVVAVAVVTEPYWQG